MVSSDGKTIERILSERDIVRSLNNTLVDTMNAPVSTLMTHDVITCTPTSTIARLMELMTEKRIRHMPVVEDNALAGIVSIGDIVSYRVHEPLEERQQIEEYISS